MRFWPLDDEMATMPYPAPKPSEEMLRKYHNYSSSTYECSYEYLSYGNLPIMWILNGDGAQGRDANVMIIIGRLQLHYLTFLHAGP